MPKPPSLEKRLRSIFTVIVAEINENPEFAQKFALALDGPPNVAGGDTPRSKQPSAQATNVRRGNRRASSLVDPLSAIQSGEETLRAQLEPLDLEQLRDVMAEYRMDPSKLAMKWKDRERVILHIIATALERIRKGDAFRA
ncbi:hypothetical protein HFO09_29775 [Rhizobium laguerreae]|uniref:hypothetical protein n=1 Tax=Rhizobium laguerreae TaxID=1076926 RepID=UPI001C90898F|nr:hypothetical protein [Rhizobium laguerreae]MBY3258700.1 hypothetical protein [Rhizobium laguerreae]MBY3286537.1 hypothetical protein [Rhizobium laguerreae]MBY3293200.1 hypothetical protein [Rhizobium laguerreae]